MIGGCIPIHFYVKIAPHEAFTHIRKKPPTCARKKKISQVKWYDTAQISHSCTYATHMENMYI